MQLINNKMKYLIKLILDFFSKKKTTKTINVSGGSSGIIDNSKDTDIDKEDYKSEKSN